MPKTLLTAIQLKVGAMFSNNVTHFLSLSAKASPIPESFSSISPFKSLASREMLPENAMDTIISQANNFFR